MIRLVFVLFCLALHACVPTYTPVTSAVHPTIAPHPTQKADGSYGALPNIPAVAWYLLERDIPLTARRILVVDVRGYNRAEIENNILKACQEYKANAVYRLPSAAYGFGRDSYAVNQFLLMHIDSAGTAQVPPRP